MKIFNGVAVNVSLIDEPDGPHGMAELVLIYSEPKWSIDAAGAIVRLSEVGSHRLMFSAKALRMLAKHLTEYAIELEKLEGRTTIEPVTADNG
jgi:hypothetical protein